MSSTNKNTDASFANEFLKHYLKGGMGAMSKSDVDALVMHLLDLYSGEHGYPLGSFSNQVASERLRTPLSKIKRLRYEAGLKYGDRPEEEARRRFVLHLANAGLEFDKTEKSVTKIVFVVEDILTKNWIQGKIKEHSGVFDNSFNTEIIKIEPNLFFRLLRTLLANEEIDAFELKYKALLKKSKKDEIKAGFKSLVSSFANGAAYAGGGLAVTTLLQLPPT
jgi:hypothetical protein